VSGENSGIIGGEIVNAPVSLVVLQRNNEDGSVEWGVGPHTNRTDEDFVKCRDRVHAVYVVTQASFGRLTPYLEAAGVVANTDKD
jgi:hypothetical protein